MNIWVILQRCAFVIIIAVVLLVAICFAVPKLRSTQVLQSTKQGLVLGNQKKEEEVQELQSNQELFRTDDQFLVDTAREAGMVRSNDFIYKFTNVPPHAVRP